MKSLAKRYGPKKNKYNAQGSSKVEGHYCPSKLEASVGQVLYLREKAKEITDIKHQVQTFLTEARIGWRVDWSYWCLTENKTIYVEAKGIETSDYRIKLKLWRVYGPGPLEIWKGRWQQPRLVEAIFPRGLTVCSNCSNANGVFLGPCKGCKNEVCLECYEQCQAEGGSCIIKRC